MSAAPRTLATLEGYAVEGGLDVTGGPATCFGPAGHLGQIALPGDADGLWSAYEAVIDAAADLAIDGVRLTLEWARLEPRPGQPDDGAFGRYRDVLAHARRRDLRTSAVLVDAAWPAWLGQDAWLMPWIDEFVLSHASRVAERLGDVLDGVVVVARPRALVESGYGDATAPPWRRRERADAAEALAHLGSLARHVAEGPLGPLVVTSFREVPALGDSAAMAELRRATDVDEVHVRSLVAGHGPTRSLAGLLARDGDAWRPTAEGRALG